MATGRARGLGKSLLKEERKAQNLEALVEKMKVQMLQRDEAAAAAAKALATGLHEKAEAMRLAHENEKGELESKLSESEREVTKRKKELSRAVDTLAKWRQNLGLEGGHSIPPLQVRGEISESALQQFEFSDRKHFSRQKRFLEAALKERDPEVIAAAISGAGGDAMLKELAKTRYFQPLVHHIIKEAAEKMQSHWNARHSLHVMSDLSLSRELFEILRHLLSFIYHAPAEREEDNAADEAGFEGGDFYERLRLYENPFNERQHVDFPALQPRLVREKERDAVLGTLDAEQSESGESAYRKNLVSAAEGMVQMYWGTGALRRGVLEGTEKLMIVGFGDATSGWNGDPITHFELGIGSFGTARAQSKVTLLNSLLCSGKDDAKTIRTKAKPFTDELTRLHGLSELTIFPPTTAAVQLAKKVPITVRFAGDFQIVKALNGMSSYSSAIWCECSEDQLLKFPTEKELPMRNFKEVLKWYKKVKCVVKTLERVCQLNGWSHAKLLGKPFAPFDCGMACKNKHKWSTEAEWTTFTKKVQGLEGAALKEYNRVWGAAHLRHWAAHPPSHQFPDMLYFSVDVLHAAFINYFKMFAELILFAYFLESKPPAHCPRSLARAFANLRAVLRVRVCAVSSEEREPIETFIRSFGIPINLKNAKSLEDISKSLAGRDCKVFAESADELLPELLLFAHAPQEARQAEACEAAATARNTGRAPAPIRGERGDNVFTMGANFDDDDDDDDDDDEGSSAEDSQAAEEDLDRLKIIELHALYFDNFFSMVRCLAPWKEAIDTEEYREARATELFNAGTRPPPASSTALAPACTLSRGLCARSQPRCVATT